MNWISRHRHVFRAVLIGVGLFISNTCVLASSDVKPHNIGLLKIELQRYHDSGKYAADISSAIRDANYYLQFRINQNKHLKHSKKIAVVLNIDETVLSNYNDLRCLQFGGTPQEISAAEAKGLDAAIPYTLSLYNYAKAHDVAVFFVSRRRQSERGNTVKNLHKLGYHNWDGMLLKPDHYDKDSIVPFKSASRKTVTGKGYDIVLNVGSQFSDLKGGYADMTIKLPNPYYFIP